MPSSYERHNRRQMSLLKIALANIRYPRTPDESITLAENAIASASSGGAGVICFPECFIPGYRGLGHVVPPPSHEFLERAWAIVGRAAKVGRITVVLGTERFVSDAPTATVLVINPDGSFAGFQDKVQVDPTEDDTYTPGTGRR